MKNISFKVNESELKRLNYYKDTTEGGKTIIADFVKSAIIEKCERVNHLRAGGYSITVPNPDNFIITDEEKEKTMQVLTQAVADLSRTNGVVGGYLTEIIAYLQFHFYTMSDKQRKVFENNFSNDLEFDAELDEMENIEHEEMSQRCEKAFAEQKNNNSNESKDLNNK